MNKEELKAKFAKEIDDEQLDEVAGGTRSEIQKDIKFLNTIGKDMEISLPPNLDLSSRANKAKLVQTWLQLDVLFDPDRNIYYEYSENLGGKAKVEKISRQDAMIVAMRANRKIVDLDEYL